MVVKGFLLLASHIHHSKQCIWGYHTWPLCRKDRILLFAEIVNNSWVLHKGSCLWKLHIPLWFCHQSTENLSGTGSSNKERAVLYWPLFRLRQSDMWKCICKASVFTVIISLSTLKKGSKITGSWKLVPML